jgi:hypothetical protein
MDLPIKDIDLNALPPDVAAAIQGLVEIAKRQEALIQELRQALHGKKSEKLSEDERQLVFEDLETAKINGVDPFAYLKTTLEQIAHGPPNRRLQPSVPDYRHAPLKWNCSAVPSHYRTSTNI